MPAKSEFGRTMADDVEFRARVNSRVNRCCFIAIFVILIAVVLALGISCIVYGAQCVGKEPCEPYHLIPVYLVLFGCVVLASLPNNFSWLINPDNKQLYLIFAIYRLFTWLTEFAILIFGSVVVYRVPLEELKKNNPKCPCLLTGYILVTISWVAICFSVILSCCMTCCYAHAVSKEAEARRKEEAAAATS